jgi:O-acetyl-ADP-ribose deacetylase (regulator of RNase III)
VRSITYLTGDATAPQGPGPKLIAHCCNNRGAWGAGFVLALSKRWQQPELQYRELAMQMDGMIPLGHVQFVAVEQGVYVANLIGQDGIHAIGNVPPIRYSALAQGFLSIADFALSISASVHMPRIGCGLAGGKWEIVESLIIDAISGRGVPVFVYDLPTKGGAR